MMGWPCVPREVQQCFGFSAIWCRGLTLPETPAPAPCPLPQVYSFSKELKGKFSDGDFNLTVRRCRHLHPRHP